MKESWSSTEGRSCDHLKLVMASERIAELDVFDQVQLAATCRGPWDPMRERTVLSCLHVILNEEWEHLRFAMRDLDAIEAGLAD